VLNAIKRGQREAASSPADAISASLKFNQKVILDPIWDTLKDKQKTILRTMAELVKPETEERLGEFLRDHMHWAQFCRHARILIALNLIVVKPRTGNTNLLDLHPLVREYIKNRFERREQDRYAVAIIVVLDRLISRFTATLKKQPSFEMLEYWTQKVELSINREDYRAAIGTLNDVMNQLISLGWPEEFVRVARRLFDSMNWDNEFQDVGAADAILHLFVDTLVQLGQRANAEDYLRRYEAAIPGKSTQYINLCDLRCHLYWYSGAYESAIEWGERGETLKTQTKADIKFSCAHNLALARRESGQYGEALTYFLGSVTLEEVLDTSKLETKKDPAFYGNIGRCLQLQGKLEEALICFRKSALLLERTGPELHKVLNQGYARFWIGETFSAQGQFKAGALFLRAAALIWENVSPPRAGTARARFLALGAANSRIADAISNLPQEQLENECKRWISGKEMRIDALGI
jgi:tetratricopeptide (TPR) repeat protein